MRWVVGLRPITGGTDQVCIASVSPPPMARPSSHLTGNLSPTSGSTGDSGCSFSRLLSGPYSQTSSHLPSCVGFGQCHPFPTHLLAGYTRSPPTRYRGYQSSPRSVHPIGSETARIHAYYATVRAECQIGGDARMVLRRNDEILVSYLRAIHQNAWCSVRAIISSCRSTLRSQK